MTPGLRISPLTLCLLAAASPLLPGCAQRQFELSETETSAILASIDEQVKGERERALEILEEPYSPARREKDVVVPDVVGLQDALRLAAHHNRDLMTRAERLILSAVALRNAQNDVGLRAAGTLGYLLEGDEDGETIESDDLRLSLTDLLPTGGEVTVSAAVDSRHGRSDESDSSAGGSYDIRLRQPLLAGFGYESSHQNLTDAEQQALYDVRDFDLARQDLAIRVQRDFYALASQMQVMRNRELNLETRALLKERSEALFDVGRASEIDKFRSAREYLSAENALIDATQAFETGLDRFKILLGIDPETELVLAPEIPDPEDFDVPLERILDISLANRLDLMTARDQVADAERRLRIREQDLLPDLQLEAVHRRRSDRERGYDDLRMDNDSYSLGLALELPLDRVRERGAVRAARIALDRSRRDLALLEDQVLADVRDSLRNLRSAENSYAIQLQIVVSEVKNHEIAQLRFERGEISNRDVSEALDELIDARDDAVRQKARLTTARLQLLRDAGVMFMKEDGSWLDLAVSQP